MHAMKKPVDWDEEAHRGRVRAYVEHVCRSMDIKPAALADQIGVAQSTLTRFLHKKDVTHTLSGKTLAKIASVSGIPAPPELGVERSIVIPAPENRLPSYAAKDLPVYGAALGGDGTVIMLNRGERVDTVSRPGTLVGVKDAFGVVIVGESMAPMYKPGHIAHIHPGRPPTPGEGVLIELQDGHAHIKEYINGNDDIVRCRQYNPPLDLKFKRKDVKRLYLIVGSGIYG